MKIAMIGAGNLATNLAKALHKAGHNIIEVYSRTMASARELATAVGALPTDRIETVTRDADIYILALKDSVLADIISPLCEGRTDGVFVHTAGSVPMDVFKGHAIRYGVVYPMQTFSKKREVDFAVIPVFVEASDEDTMNTLEEMSKSVSGDVRRLDSPSRRYLHLAAVFACNFANHCYALAADMVERSGMTFDCLLPLIDETARKVHQLPPDKAQTGPAVRFDRNVIDAQSHLLEDTPMAQQIYNIMSESIHQKAKIMINYDLKKIRAIIFDVDGVLSSETIPLHPGGEPMRTVNIKDGYAIQLAVKMGLRIVILTGGKTESVRLRYTNLGVEDVYMACAVKIKKYEEFLEKYGLHDDEIMYMGDDIPDYEIMKRVGCPVCPADACSDIKNISIYISQRNGGCGCGRDVIEQVLRAQGKWLNGQKAFGW